MDRLLTTLSDEILQHAHSNLQEEVCGIGPVEVAGREQHAGLLDRVGHRAAVGRGDAERLLDEHVLARFSCC